MKGRRTDPASTLQALTNASIHAPSEGHILIAKVSIDEPPQALNEVEQASSGMGQVFATPLRRCCSRKHGTQKIKDPCLPSIFFIPSKRLFRTLQHDIRLHYSLIFDSTGKHASMHQFLQQRDQSLQL